MGVRWTITFKTVNGRTGLVKVYDSTYSGNPIALDPAANAFYASCQQQDIFQPVQTNSGYLRVIDKDIASEHIEDMHPFGALDRPVEFYIGSTLTWRGYISPEAFSVDWDAAPRVVSFPLVGALDVLASVNITDNGTGLQTIAAFLKECLEATGFAWSGVVVCPQMRYISDEMQSYMIGELRLSLSRYNFISPNTSENREDADWTPMVGRSYLSVLQDICRYFCWIAVMQGDRLYLSSPIYGVGYYISYFVKWSALSALALDAKATPADIQPYGVSDRETRNLTEIPLDGINHRKSMRNGAKKVILTTDIGYSDEVFPKMEFNGKRLRHWSIDGSLPPPHTGSYYSMVDWLDPTYENVKLHAYVWNSGTSTFDEVAWAAPAAVGELPRPAGGIVKADFWTDMSGKFNYNYSSYIRLTADRMLYGTHVTTDLPLCTITAEQVGVFPVGGAFCLSGLIGASYSAMSELSKDYLGLSNYQNLNGALRLSIKVGDYYYNGSAWVDTLSIISVPLDGNRIQNTKTLSMPYNGADGFLIPLDMTLNGQMEVTFYPWTDNALVSGEGSTAIFINDFRVGYYNDSEAYRISEGLRLSALTGKSFQEEKSVALRLSSVKDSKIGHGILWWNGKPVGNDNIFSYALTLSGKEKYQPEYWLLNALTTVFTKPSVWLELETGPVVFFDWWGLIVYEGKKYLVMSHETDYADEHTKLIIASYE